MLAGNNALGIGVLPSIAGRQNTSQSNPRAPGNDRIVNLDKVDRAMDLLVGQEQFPEVGPAATKVNPVGKQRIVNPASADIRHNTSANIDGDSRSTASVRALEQRIGFLESENHNMRTALSAQMSSMMAKMAQTEERMMTEVQRRVELELEVRAKAESSGVVEAQSFKRLAQLERLVEAQQSEMSQMSTRLSAAQDRLEAIPVMQDRVDAAVTSIHGAGAESAAVDDQVSRLRDGLRKRDAEVREFEERESRKGAVLFGEVSRLGKAIELAGTKTDRALLLMQKRFEAVESRLKADERGIIAMEGRDAERFEGLGRRAEQLEKYLVELSDMSLKQRQELDAEAARRKRASEEQQNLVAEVRSALATSDAGVSDRLTALLTQIGEQLVTEREISNRRLEETMQDSQRKERAAEERAAAERDRMAKRFMALEESMRVESETRAKQHQQQAKEADARALELTGMVQREQTARTGVQKILEETQERVTSEARASIVLLTKDVETRTTSLEEVVRTEIKSRMRGQEKVFASLTSLSQQQQSAVGRARQEAAKMLDQVNHTTEKRLLALEQGLDRVQRESLIALSRNAQSQALLNADLEGRLDNLEKRELQDENETEQIRTDLTKQIESFSRANTDAIGALQSVVADHRRENEEIMAKLQADVERELEGSADNLRQAVTSFSSDMQGEVEKLREETVAGLGDLKAETAKLFAETAETITAVDNRVGTLKDTVDSHKAAQGVINRMSKQDEEEYRVRVANDAADDSIAGCVSDIIARLEGEELIATIGVARREIDVISSSVKEEVSAKVAQVGERLDKNADVAVRERGSIRDDMRLMKEELADASRTSAASTVAEALKARVVEDGLEERLAALEKNLDDKVRGLAEREETNAKIAAESNAAVQVMLQKAKEQRLRLEARVEGVIGQVESERQNEESEWEASIAAAEAEDGADEMGGVLSPRARDEDALTGPTGALPTADVGFPPMSED